MGRRGGAPDSLFYTEPLDAIRSKALQKDPYYDSTLGYNARGTFHNTIKQQNGQSCGATALFMLYTDLVRSQETTMKLPMDFWDWYARCDLTQGKDLIYQAKTHTNLLKRGFKLSSTTLNISKRSDPTLIKLLLSKGYPVICSITHKEIAGHWIVIDHFEGEHFYVRDPFVGKAYRITAKELLENTAGDPQTCLYLERTGIVRQEPAESSSGEGPDS